MNPDASYETIHEMRRRLAPLQLCGRCLDAAAREGRWICGPCKSDIDMRARRRALKQQHPGGEVSPGFQEGKIR